MCFPPGKSCRSCDWCGWCCRESHSASVETWRDKVNADMKTLVSYLYLHLLYISHSSFLSTVYTFILKCNYLYVNTTRTWKNKTAWFSLDVFSSPAVGCSYLFIFSISFLSILWGCVQSDIDIFHQTKRKRQKIRRMQETTRFPNRLKKVKTIFPAEISRSGNISKHEKTFGLSMFNHRPAVESFIHPVKTSNVSETTHWAPTLRLVCVTVWACQYRPFIHIWPGERIHGRLGKFYTPSGSGQRRR